MADNNKKTGWARFSWIIVVLVAIVALWAASAHNNEEDDQSGAVYTLAQTVVRS